MINRALFTLVLISSALASAQASRVWVSGVGDDLNPCSRTAPCLTLTGSLAKVVAGGEINMLDPADIGEVIITQSVTISAEPLAGVTAPATGASVVIAAPGANVRLRNLHFIAAASGVPAVRVLDAASLSIENCRFSGFTDSAVVFTGDGGALYVDGSHFRGDNLGGISVTSPSPQNTVITDSTFFGHAIAVEANGPVRVTTTDSEFTANSVAAIRVGGGAQVNLERGEIVDSALGVDSADGVIRLSNSQLSGNGQNTHIVGGARVDSFGNNRIVPDTCSLPGLDAGTHLVGVPMAVPFEGYGLLGVVAWSAPAPAGLSADGGVLQGTPTAVGQVTGMVSATDQRGCTASGGFDLDIVCPPISLTPTSLADVDTGEDMTPVQFVASGSTSPASTFTVNGALPIGVTFIDGGLAGFPTEPGAFPLTVNVVDGFGCGDSQTVTLTVNAAAGFQATTLALSVAAPAYAQTSTGLVATLGGFTGAPSGTVTFFEGTTELGSATMQAAGTATLTTDQLTAGTHVVTATYSGDTTFGGSRAPAYSFDVVLIPTMTSVALQDSQLVANVTSIITPVSGQVEFTVDGSTLAAVPVNGAGNAIISAPTTVGSHTVQARFLANTRFAESSSMTLAVNVSGNDGGMTADGGTPATDGGTTTPDGGNGGGETPKTGCGCNQADVGAMLLAALALFRRRRVV